MSKPAREAPEKGPKPRFGKGQPSHYCGKPGRSGPPRGNRNALRHGLRGAVLPKDARYIQNRLDNIKRILEDAVLRARGAVDEADAAAIQTAQRWERVACLAERWARLKGDELKDKMVDYYERAAKASEARDKAIARLKLGDQRDNVLDALYSRPTTPTTGNGDEPS